MFLSISLRNPFAKIISMLSKNWAQQSYLILNFGWFCDFFSQNARNIHAESVAIRKFLRWVLLASERAPASPTSTASPLARAPPFTAMLQNSRCRESITFPIRKFFRSDVERIESAFPCLLGLTILLLQTIFVSKKKQWKMESTKQIRSIRPIRGQKNNPYSLPFREGPGVGIPSGRGRG